MAKDPAFPFYASDFLTDTMRWTREMKSLHVDLLAESWLNGGLNNHGSTAVQPNTQPNVNQDYPEGLTDEDQTIWLRIKSKWELIDGMWFNRKLEDVRENRKKFLKRQSDKGKASAEARKNNPKPAKEKFNRGSTAVQPIEKENEYEKEIEKRKKEFEPPSPEDVQVFVQMEGFPVELGIHVYKYYNDAEWKDSTGKQVKNWKQKIRGVWLKEENKSYGKQSTTTKTPDSRLANSLASVYQHHNMGNG